MPTELGVEARSIHTTLKTERFNKTGSTACDSARYDESELRPLEEAVDGFDGDGRPFWDFTVTAEHLRGYSVACVPKEFIQALGCEPDERIKVNVTDGAGPGLLSAAWLLTSTTGGISGRVRHTLTRLAATKGDGVRITIVEPGGVRMTMADERRPEGR